MNLFKVCPGSFSQACFSPQLTRQSYGLHLLSFAFQWDPYCGQSAGRMLLPYVSCRYCRGWLLSIIVYFYKLYRNALDFWQNLEYTAPILRVPLSIFDVLRFPEEATKLQANFLLFFLHFLEGVQCFFSGFWTYQI